MAPPWFHWIIRDFRQWSFSVLEIPWILPAGWNRPVKVRFIVRLFNHNENLFRQYNFDGTQADSRTDKSLEWLLLNSSSAHCQHGLCLISIWRVMTNVRTNFKTNRANLVGSVMYAVFEFWHSEKKYLIFMFQYAKRSVCLCKWSTRSSWQMPFYPSR